MDIVLKAAGTLSPVSKSIPEGLTERDGAKI